MMITDVILEASTEHEIYFLLAAYIEALQYCDKPEGLPESTTGLPLNGIDDVSARLEGLHAELEKPVRRSNDRDRTIITEAMKIFSAALNRLRALEEGKARPSAHREAALTYAALS